MKRGSATIAATALAAMALTGCAASGIGPRGEFYNRLLTARADPGAVVAAETAFQQDARALGQWTAFRKYATADAVMFVPEKVVAQDWLKGRKDPATSVEWQAHEVLSSCDGSLAVTRGAAQWPGGYPGDYLTVWQRQQDGSLKWVADLGQSRKEPLPAPDLVRTKVATCAPPAPAAGPADAAAALAGGISSDRTLRWDIVQAGKDVTVKVRLWDGTSWAETLSLPIVLE